MKHLILPSWVAAAPNNAGSTKCGKLGADEWRSLCTINLVYTLGRLWGSQPEDSREFKMYRNFMDLIIAVRFAHMRTMTAERISQYRLHMVRYLTDMKLLYPGAHVVPSVGPVHAWRCFPFERYNFLLQQIPTNMKFGELEQTMFNRFCEAQNLRALFCAEKLPSELRELIPEYKRVFEGDIRGTLVNDMLAYDEHFNSRYAEVTWSEQAFQHTYITRLGETFATASASARDSLVVYRSHNKERRYGRIHNIFSHTQRGEDNIQRSLTFFVVAPFDCLSSRHAFQGLSYAGCDVAHNRLSQPAVLVTNEDIVSHFACGPYEDPKIKGDLIFMLSLEKARLLLSSTSVWLTVTCIQE
ncbi:hypothetical protein P692DRAFT_20849864 [Suillus brevipes Sb2]|nr:hypothetical protein P692DRAFT_20849864 [Suillus brevipes Sb2]